MRTPCKQPGCDRPVKQDGLCKMHATRVYQRRQRDNAQAVLDALKVAVGCVDCGYNRHPHALQFDHIDPDTKRRELGWVKDRSSLVTPGMLKQYIEHVTRHCEVRCANCHAERTASEKHYLNNQNNGRTEQGTWVH